MGFTINETITTTLHYKDIALIAIAMGEYKKLYKDTADKDVLKRMELLVNRLGEEMYNHPDNEPEDHVTDLYTPSQELADILGSNEKLMRTVVIKKLWHYIKDNNLQDQKERRYINLDEKMKKVFTNNKDKISMFDLSNYLKVHLTK